MPKFHPYRRRSLPAVFPVARAGVPAGVPAVPVGPSAFFRSLLVHAKRTHFTSNPFKPHLLASSPNEPNPANRAKAVFFPRSPRNPERTHSRIPTPGSPVPFAPFTKRTQIPHNDHKIHNLPAQQPLKPGQSEARAAIVKSCVALPDTSRGSPLRKPTSRSKPCWLRSPGADRSPSRSAMRPKNNGSRASCGGCWCSSTGCAEMIAVSPWPRRKRARPPRKASHNGPPLARSSSFPRCAAGRPLPSARALPDRPAAPRWPPPCAPRRP